MKGKLPKGFEKCGRKGGSGAPMPEGISTIIGTKSGDKRRPSGTLPYWSQKHLDGVDRLDVYANVEQQQILVVPNAEGDFRVRVPATRATVHVTFTEAFARLGLEAPTKPVRVPLTWDERGWFVFDLSEYKA